MAMNSPSHRRRGTVLVPCLLLLKVSLLLFLTACRSEAGGGTPAGLAPTTTPTFATLATPAPATPIPATVSATAALLLSTPTPSPPPPAPTSSPDPSPSVLSGTWRLGQPMPSPARSELPAVTLGEWIYLPGGFGGFTRLERYRPASDEWQTLAEMPAGRHHLMATAYEGHLYVLGGAEAPGWNPTATVWRYDPATDQWQTLADMPEARLAGAAVTLGDSIYVLGGAGGSGALLRFDLVHGSWESGAAPAQPREHVSAVVYRDEIWLLGGRWSGVGELATVEIYNPNTSTWRAGPSLNVARAGFAAAVAGEQLWAAGGEVIINGSETLASFEFLASAEAGWQSGPPLPVPIHGVGGAALADQFYLLGGSTRAGAIENEGHVQIYSSH